MAKKNLNDRCPLQGECEKKICSFSGHELDCDYYHSFARPGYEIEDQEAIRFKREDEAMMAAYEASSDDPDAAQRERWRLGDFTYPDEEDGGEDAESPSAAEIAAVAPLELDEDILPPVEVLPASLHLDGDTGVTEKIKKAMYDAANQFVYIGFLLWEVQEYGYYREKGYSSVYEYAETELGFKKSSTKNFIAINYEFGCRDDRPRGIAHQRTMSLQPQYKQFKYSQLCEMLSMSDKQREKVTPDMTVKQIRDLKRGEAEPDLPPNMETIPIPLPDDALDSGQTSGQSEKFVQSCVVNNCWADIPGELLFDLFKLVPSGAKVRYNPRSCYDITIKLHKG